MKSKYITSAIILALTCMMVVNAQRRTKPRANTAVRERAPKIVDQPETPEAAFGAKSLELIEKESAVLSKLSNNDKEILRVTTDHLQKEIGRTKLGDALTKSLYNLQVSIGKKSSLERQLDACLAFLPEGITRLQLIASWDALNDARILEDSAENNIISSNVLKIIDKYGLEGNSLYRMSLEVLEVGSLNAAVVSEILKRLK